MARILIADDSPAARRALRGLLEESGWEVCGEAENGLEAVDKTGTLKPDLVILDLVMPKMNGLQAARTIHTADPQIPMLLWTLMQVDERLAQGACDEGFQGAVSKESGIFALSQAVEALLKGKTFFLPPLPTPVTADANAPASSAKEELVTAEEAKPESHRNHP
ncbi:MAG: response regulator transcription factor [Candidatus Acidiferrales bacterium]